MFKEVSVKLGKMLFIDFHFIKQQLAFLGTKSEQLQS